MPRLLTATRVTPASGTMKPPPFLVQLPYYGGAAGKLAVQAAGTQHVTGLLSAPPGTYWESVAAVGNSTKFVAAAGPTGSKCASLIYTFTLSAAGKPTGLKPLNVSIPGRLASNTSLAVSSDGRTIAYASAPYIVGSTAAPIIGVISAGGAARRWTLPASASPTGLSLSGHGSELGYAVLTLLDTRHTADDHNGGAWILPTHARPGNAFDRSRRFLAGHDSSPVAAALSPDGTIIYVVTAVSASARPTGGPPYALTLAAYRTANGALLRTLHTWRNVPMLFPPSVTIGGDQLLIWGIHQPGTYQVDLASGGVEAVWMYTPDGEFPEAVAW